METLSKEQRRSQREARAQARWERRLAQTAGVESRIASWQELCRKAGIDDSAGVGQAIYLGLTNPDDDKGRQWYLQFVTAHWPELLRVAIFPLIKPYLAQMSLLPEAVGASQQAEMVRQLKVTLEERRLGEGREPIGRDHLDAPGLKLGHLVREMLPVENKS